MRSLLLSIAIVAAALASWGAPARAQNTRAHQGAAERAIVKERWCEAVFLYAKLDEVDANPEWALRAADAAQSANDRARAISLFQSALARAPKHPRARAMEQSIAALERLVANSGAGSVCGPPPAECGNGVLEGSETCDDGNRQSGDACPNTCTGTAPVVSGSVAPPVAVPAVPPSGKAAPPAAVAKPGAPEVVASKLCTLIKPVKIFIKGEWKTYEFGSTLSIKSAGPQWTMVETPAGDSGRVAASTMADACAHADIAPPPPVVGTTTSPSPVSTTPVAPAPTPQASTVTEPRAVEEPAPVVAEPAPPAVEEIEPLQDERGPAAVAPRVAEAGGGGIGGWVMLGIGGALALGGGTAAVVGAQPYFQYAGLCATGFGSTNCPALESLGEDYQAENDADDRAVIADDAAELRVRVDNAAQAWDEGVTGRVMLGAGAGTAALGVGLMVGGLVWALSSGGEAQDQQESE